MFLKKCTLFDQSKQVHGEDLAADVLDAVECAQAVVQFGQHEQVFGALVWIGCRLHQGLIVLYGFCLLSQLEMGQPQHALGRCCQLLIAAVQQHFQVGDGLFVALQFEQADSASLQGALAHLLVVACQANGAAQRLHGLVKGFDFDLGAAFHIVETGLLLLVCADFQACVERC